MLNQDIITLINKKQEEIRSKSFRLASRDTFDAKFKNNSMTTRVDVNQFSPGEYISTDRNTQPVDVTSLIMKTAGCKDCEHYGGSQGKCNMAVDDEFDYMATSCQLYTPIYQFLMKRHEIKSNVFDISDDGVSAAEFRSNLENGGSFATRVDKGLMLMKDAEVLSEIVNYKTYSTATMFALMEVTVLNSDGFPWSSMINLMMDPSKFMNEIVDIQNPSANRTIFRFNFDERDLDRIEKALDGQKILKVQVKMNLPVIIVKRNTEGGMT